MIDGNARPPARPDRVLLLAAVVATGLRVWQFLSRPPLWLDELALIQNVAERPVADLLTQPLWYGQTAPRGFLLALDLARAGFGTGESAWRLVPFLASIAAVPLFVVAAAKILDRWTAVVAITLFATAAPLVFYAAQAKPYASDLLVATILLLLGLDLIGRVPSRDKAIGMTAFGMVSPWLSLAAILASLGTVVALTPRYARDPRTRLPWLIAAGLVALGAIAVAAPEILRLTPELRSYLDDYWSGGYPPIPLWRAIPDLWPANRIHGLLGSAGLGSFGYPFPALFSVILVIGWVTLARQHREVAGVVLAPVALAIGAALVRGYPFRDRLLLFLAPALFFGLAAGIVSIGRWAAAGWRPLGPLLGCCLTGLAVVPMVRRPPPYRIDDIRPVLARIQADWREGDVLYLYRGANRSIEYYGPRFGFPPDRYRLGGCRDDDPRSYFAEVDQLRGRSRVWVLMMRSTEDRADLWHYLDQLGPVETSFSEVPSMPGYRFEPVEVRRYDLSDTTKSATRAPREPPAPGSAVARANCRIGPNVPRERR